MSHWNAAVSRDHVESSLLVLSRKTQVSKNKFEKIKDLVLFDIEVLKTFIRDIELDNETLESYLKIKVNVKLFLSITELLRHVRNQM